MLYPRTKTETSRIVDRGIMTIVLKHNTAGISHRPEKIVNKTTKAGRYNRQFLDLCIKTKTLSRFCAHGPCFQMSIISKELSHRNKNNSEAFKNQNDNKKTLKKFS